MLTNALMIEIPILADVLLIAIPVLLIGSIVAYYIYKISTNRKMKKEGIETEAVVTRVRTEIGSATDNNSTYSIYYVEYTNRAGQKIEAELINEPARDVWEGSTITIRYLPDKPNKALCNKKD